MAIRTSTLVICIIIILIGAGCLFYYVLPNERNYSYSGIEAFCEYPQTNISNEELIGAFENESKITINQVNLDNGIDFVFLDDNLTLDEQDRIWSYIAFRTNGEFRIDVRYQSSNPLNGTVSSQEEKSVIDEMVDAQYEIDKEVVDQYLTSLTTFINNELGIEYDFIEFMGVDYGEKYQMDE